jgi:D-alanine-D-alanine ligase
MVIFCFILTDDLCYNLIILNFGGIFMKIVVLAGGLSPERDVSLSSGCLIANALLESGHKVLLLDVYEGMEIRGRSCDSLFAGPEQGKNMSTPYPRRSPIWRKSKGGITASPP